MLRREALTRYSHTRIGYLWAVLEPIAHLLTLGVLFRIFTQGPPPVGDSLFLFYLTGLIPFLVFWQVSQDMIASLPSATFLLQLPTVHPLDIALTRSILYFGTQLASAVVVFGIVGIMGLDVLPSNFLESAAALLTLWGMATGIGLINVVISVFVRSWETFFAAFNRLLYFASGIYYSPIRMPPEIRDILTLNPILQGIEWFRIGFYDRYDPPWVDRVYLVVCALSTLLLGLALFRYFRARLAVQT